MTTSATATAATTAFHPSATAANDIDDHHQDINDNRSNNSDIDDDTHFVPKLYLLMENKSKSNNLGPILRCATAFGIETMIVVGYSKCSTEGSHGASKHVQMIDFPTSRQAMEYLRTTCHCTTIIGLLGSLCEDSYWNDDNNKNNNANDGYSVIHDPSDDLAKIEWHPTSATVVPTKNTNENNAATTMNHHYYLSARSYPAHHYRRMNPSSATSYYNYNNSNDKSSWKRRGNICIALGKERYGLSIQLAQCCDSFLHVPYPSIVRTTTTTLTDAGNPMPSSSAVVVSSLLNVPACLSIALHEITCMYQYHENLFQGHKFDVDRKHTYPVTNSNNSNDDTNDNDNSNTLRPYHKIDTKSHEEVTSFDQQHHDDDGNNWEDDVYNMDNLFGTETEC